MATDVLNHLVFINKYLLKGGNEELRHCKIIAIFLDGNESLKNKVSVHRAAIYFYPTKVNHDFRNWH